MFNLQMVIEFLTKLNASVTAIDNFSSELEEIKGRLHNLEESCLNEQIDAQIEEVLDNKDYLDAYEVEDKISDAISERVDNMNLDDKIDDAIHNTDWNDKVYEAVNGFTFSVDVNH